MLQTAVGAARATARTAGIRTGLPRLSHLRSAFAESAVSRISLHDALCWIVFGDAGPQWTSQRIEDEQNVTVAWTEEIRDALKAWDAAEQQLVEYLRNKDHLVARGRRNGLGEPADIPEDFRRGGTLTLVPLPEPEPGPNPKGNYALHEFDPSRAEWYDITLDFADIQRLFPSNSYVPELAQPGQDRNTYQAPSVESTPRGYKADDEPLLHEMAHLVDSRKCASPWAAAEEVADRARGGGTVTSRAKRLHRQFRRFQSSQPRKV
jgi:hypothetical protein